MSSLASLSTVYCDSSSQSGDQETCCCGDLCDGCSHCDKETPSNIPESCPYWECCWADVPLTSSAVTLSPSFIQLPQHIKAIRLGVSSLTLYTQKEITIYCYLNHLEKQMGWTIQSVTCFYEPDKFVELKTCGADDQGGELFAVSILGRPKDEAAITLKFRFYLSGSTSFYDCQLCDVRLGNQLWEAAVKQQLTDVELFVGDRSFPAHKFLLAARSPFFAVMFGTDMVESRTGRVKVGNVDPDTFHQFLRFLYTGQLEEPASEKLSIIADKCNVKTLAAICESASFSFDADAEYLFASARSAKPVDHGNLFLLSPDKRMAALFWKSADVSMTDDPSWAVCCKEGGHSVMSSMSIRRNFVLCLTGTQPHSFRGNFIMPDQICLSGGRPDQDAFRIAEVFCSSKRYTLDEDQRYFSRMKPLHDLPGSEADAQQANMEAKFIAKAHLLDLLRFLQHSDVTMEFHVCHTPSIPEFRYAFRDFRLSRDLWKSSVNKEWTDVDFLVGDRTFSAHRALLAARCPALIPPGSSKSSAAVTVENVEVSVFKKLLRFLYTGELQTFPPSEALYKAALIYQVDLLKRLFEMRHPEKVSDISSDFPMN